jgi:hypothetical protein
MGISCAYVFSVYFGHPSGGLFFFRDFFIAACQLPRIFRTSGLGPGLALGLESGSDLALFFHWYLSD